MWGLFNEHLTSGLSGETSPRSAETCSCLALTLRKSAAPTSTSSSPPWPCSPSPSLGSASRRRRAGRLTTSQRSSEEQRASLCTAAVDSTPSPEEPRRPPSWSTSKPFQGQSRVLILRVLSAKISFFYSHLVVVGLQSRTEQRKKNKLNKYIKHPTGML